MADITAQEDAYFHKMFQLYDTDKSGAIGLSELRNLAKHLGVELTDDSLIASVKSIGTPVVDGDFELPYPLFVKWLQQASASGDEFAMLKAKITAQGMRALNNSQIAKLKEVFDNFDADGSGSIDAGELGVMFASIGQDASEEAMQELIAGVDDDGSGQIEFDEFMVLMCGKFGSHSFEEDMRQAFTEADPESTGKVPVEVLRDLMRRTAEIPSDEITSILESIDCVSADGSVEYMKWEALWEACREDML